LTPNKELNRLREIDMNIRKDMQEALEAYEAQDYALAHSKVIGVIETFPEAAHAYQMLSLILRKTGNMKGAFEAIKRAVALKPDNAEFQNSFGTFYRLVGRNDLALEFFKKAVKIAPNYVIAVMNLGDLYLQNNNPLAALSVFDAAIPDNADHAGLRHGRALALKDSLQYEAALQQFSDLPPKPEYAMPMGQIFHETRRIPEAKMAFGQGLSHPPIAVQSFRNLVMIEHAYNGHEAAVSMIDEALQANPKALAIQATGAQLLHDIHETDRAVEILDRADKVFEPHPVTAQMRGNILIARGEADAAADLVDSFNDSKQIDAALMSVAARANLMRGEADHAWAFISHGRQLAPLNQYWIAMEASYMRQKGDEKYSRRYDYDKFVRVYDLDPPAEYGSQEAFIEALTTSLLAQHDSQHHPIGQSLRGGSQTSQNLIFVADHVIQDFFQALNTPLQDYMQHIGTAGDHILTVRNTGKHRFSGGWSVKLAGEGFHVNHIHPKGWISSSFYVALPASMGGEAKKQGWIKFGEPSFDAPDAKGKRQGPEHWVEPKAGRLVLFPSYMWHGTVPFTGNEMRLTLPFDAVPAS
jgi:uncharacterized protein (TIGR02466 family)